MNNNPLTTTFVLCSYYYVESDQIFSQLSSDD